MATSSAELFDFPAPSIVPVPVVTSDSWPDLVRLVNMSVASSGARKAIVRLPSETMALTQAHFIAETRIIGVSGVEYLIAGELRNVTSLEFGDFTVHSTTSPTIVFDGRLNGGTFDFAGGTFKSNTAAPFLSINAGTSDITIRVFGSTFTSATGPVIKVEAAGSVAIELYGNASIGRNTISSTAGQSVTVKRFDTRVDVEAQTGMNGSDQPAEYDATADVIGFTPTTPANFTGTVATVQAALDQLASGVSGSGGASSVRSITVSDSPLTADSDDTMILVDSSGGAVTVVLPTKAANRRITVKDSAGSASTNQITVQPGGVGELIDGSSNFVIDVDRAAISFVCDGSNWHAF